jgi:hypothetical protein
VIRIGGKGMVQCASGEMSRTVAGRVVIGNAERATHEVAMTHAAAAIVTSVVATVVEGMEIVVEGMATGTGGLGMSLGL